MFRLRAYGGLSLERDGMPYAGQASQRRRLAVLAVLAAATDAGVSRERLMNFLWPDADPARARHSLDEALSGLRREFRSDGLFIGVATLHLNREMLPSDLDEHATALASRDEERAISVYSGPFLDGFYIPAAADFEHWVDSERRTRARAHARLLEGLAERATLAGDSAAAVRWWQSRVALDPLDTPAALSLLRALTAAGNPSEAIRQARVHEALVRQELDTTPGPGWQAVVERLRAEPDRLVVPSMPALIEPLIAFVVEPGTTPAVVSPTDAITTIGNATRSSITVPAAGVTAPWFSSRSRYTAIGVGGAVIIAALASARSVWSRPSREPQNAAGLTATARGSTERSSVAVLPFANTSGDPADEPFSDGLTDELIGALSRVPGVRVTGRTSAFALKGRGLTVRSVADTLGVVTVLEGSVRRDGNRLKVSAQLIDALDNGVLWAESYDRELQDVFAVQEEIARAIVRALAPKLANTQSLFRPIQPRDLATYELYLKGRFYLARRSPADLRRAADHFEQAVARDPSFAQAFAGLADTRVLLVLLGSSPPAEQLPGARAAAASAIRLDSTLAEAHAALGNIREAFDWDAQGADRALKRAVALDPGYATAHLYRGIHLLNLGQFDEAVAELTLARTLDPLSAAVCMQLGRAHLFVRRSADAVGFLRTATELNPEFGAAYSQLGEAYLQQGKSADALNAFQRAASLTGGRDSAHLAYAFAATGQRAAAVAILDALIATPKHPYLPPVPMAKAYAALDSADAAFRWLEMGFTQRAAQMRTIKVAPAFVALSVDPRWQVLLRRMRMDL